MIAVAFPGQGTQYVGMAGSLTTDQRTYFDQASEYLGYDLWELCQQGPEEQLMLTQYAQPAIMVTCLSLWSKLRQCISVDVFLGHSLGEVTALVAAGAISFGDGVKIVAKRGKLMQHSFVPGKMVALIGLTEELVEKLIQEVHPNGYVTIANYNAPGQLVISGDLQAVDQVANKAVAIGAKRAIPLQVSGPFHSELMRAASEEFAVFLDQFTFSDPQYPVVSNVNIRLITSSKQVKMELVQQITSPVRWIDNIKHLERLGLSEFIEIGPGNVLCGLVKRISPQLRLTSYP
mgnify:FL=1